MTSALTRIASALLRIDAALTGAETKTCSKCKVTMSVDMFYRTEGQCKMCKREYRQQNREAIAEWRRGYRQRNREAIADYMREYRQQNREAIADYKRRFQRRNREAIAKRKRGHYQQHREQILEQKRDYLQQNLHLWRAYGAKRRARKRDRLHPDHNPDFEKCLCAQAARMRECLGIDFHVDHIKPLAKGGWHHHLNMQILPASINTAKGSKLRWRHPFYRDITDLPAFLR